MHTHSLGHTHTPTYTRRRGIFGLKFYRTYPDRLTQAHKCTPSNAFAISVLTDKWALLWCLLENRLFHHFTHFPDVISSGRSSRQPVYFQMQRSSQSHRGRLPVCDVLWLGKKETTVTYGFLQKIHLKGWRQYGFSLFSSIFICILHTFKHTNKDINPRLMSKAHLSLSSAYSFPLLSFFLVQKDSVSEGWQVKIWYLVFHIISTRHGVV